MMTAPHKMDTSSMINQMVMCLLHKKNIHQKL